MSTPITSIMEASGWFSSSPTSSTRRSSCFTSWRYSRSLCGTRSAGSTCGQAAKALFSCAVDMLFSHFPFARVVFGVGQHRANIHFPAIIVKRGDEASLVSADVEHGQPADLIRVRQQAPKFGEVCRIVPFQCPIPMRQPTRGGRMFGRVFVEPFARDDVHGQ